MGSRIIGPPDLFTKWQRSKTSLNLGTAWFMSFVWYGQGMWTSMTGLARFNCWSLSMTWRTAWCVPYKVCYWHTRDIEIESHCHHHHFTTVDDPCSCPLFVPFIAMFNPFLLKPMNLIQDQLHSSASLRWCWYWRFRNLIRITMDNFCRVV